MKSEFMLLQAAKMYNLFCCKPIIKTTKKSTLQTKREKKNEFHMRNCTQAIEYNKAGIFSERNWALRKNDIFGLHCSRCCHIEWKNRTNHINLVRCQCHSQIFALWKIVYTACCTQQLTLLNLLCAVLCHAAPYIISMFHASVWLLFNQFFLNTCTKLQPLPTMNHVSIAKKMDNKATTETYNKTASA